MRASMAICATALLSNAMNAALSKKGPASNPAHASRARQPLQDLPAHELVEGPGKGKRAIEVAAVGLGRIPIACRPQLDASGRRPGRVLRLRERVDDTLGGEIDANEV